MVTATSFCIEKTLGEGAVGKVYLAKRDQRLVALKTLRANTGKETLDFFKREVRILSHLSHPNLIKILDFFETGSGDISSPFFVMEYVPGSPLDRLGKLSADRWMEIFSQAAQGMRYLHSRKILHHDLKPSNLYLSEQGRLKILDFSLSIQGDDLAGDTQGGTLPFMPPEAFERFYDERSDIFAMGVVFYQVMTGAFPYNKILSKENLRTIETPQSARQRAPEIPEFFSDLLQKMISLNPENRPASFASILRFLQLHSDLAIELNEDESDSVLEKPPLVGRSTELEQIRHWLHQGWRETPTLALTGPTGIGRSRLLEEIRWELLLSSQKAYFFSPQFASSWKQVYANAHSGDDVSQDFDLWEWADRYASDFEKQETLLIFSDLHLFSETERGEILSLLGILQKSKTRYRVLLEWDDSPGMGGSEFRPLIQDATTLRLADLSREHIGTLLKEASLGFKIPTAILDSLADISGGRPLLGLEALRQWRLKRVEDPDSLASFSFPRNLEEALQRNLEILSPSGQLLLSHVASHATPVSMGDLELLWKDQRDRLEAARLECEQKEFTQIQGTMQDTVALKHPSLQALYAKYLPKAILDRAHHEWISLLESREAEHQSQPKDILALMEHAMAMGDELIMAKLAMPAMGILDSLGLHQKAIVWSERFLKMKNPALDRVGIYAYRAPLFFRLARYQESLDAYQSWFKIRVDDETQLQKVKFHYYSGLVYFTWGKLAEARHSLGLCLLTGDARKHPGLRPYVVRSLNLLASMDLQAGNAALARRALQDALKFEVQDPGLVGEIHQKIGELETEQLQFNQARVHLERCWEHYAKTERPNMMAIAANAQALLHKAMGETEFALEKSGEAIALAKQSRERVPFARFLGNHALILQQLGRYGEAIEAIEDSVKILSVLGTDAEKWVAILQMAEIHLYAGNLERLNGLWKEIQNQRALLETLSLWPAALLLKGEAEAVAGEDTLALQLFQSANESTMLRSPLAILQDRIQTWKSRARAGGFPEPIEGSEEIRASLAETSGPWAEGWKACLDFLQRKAEETSKAELENCLAVISSMQSPEWRMEMLRLLQGYALRRGLPNLALFLRQHATREWIQIFQLLPEELKMDYEKNRGLYDIDEALKAPVSRKPTPPAASAVSPAPAATSPRPQITEERFRQFCEISDQLAQNDDLADILERVMDAAILLTGAERGFLILKSETAEDAEFPGFEVHTARHINRQTIKEQEFQFSFSLVEKAISQGAPVFTSNAMEDPRFQEMKSIHLYQLKSILVVPIETQGKVLGVLYLDHRFKPDSFSQEDVVVLAGFARQAAQAIQKVQKLTSLETANVELESQIQAQANQLEALSEELNQARKNLKYEYTEIIGSSPAMLKVFKLLDHVSKTRIPVWIWGESGTGKELIANSLHTNSPRKDGPFISENCSSIPETLLESELFGHKKGSFTHADRDRVGLFEQAHGGTLFLDEVADMSLNMQVKMLRVLQEGEIRPVGSSKKVKVDVRLVTASNRDLSKMVLEGKFREDLFYRINGLTLRVPPLRQRKEDIPGLVYHLIKKIARDYDLPACKITKDAFQYLLSQPWPGNIRELEGFIRNAMMFADGKSIDRNLLKMNDLLIERDGEDNEALEEAESKRPLDENASERAQLIEALRRHRLDKKAVADELGISLKSVYLRMQRHHIPKKSSLLIQFLERG